jgi:hypothetical protein
MKDIYIPVASDIRFDEHAALSTSEPPGVRPPVRNISARQCGQAAVNGSATSSMSKSPLAAQPRASGRSSAGLPHFDLAKGSFPCQETPVAAQRRRVQMTEAVWLLTYRASDRQIARQTQIGQTQSTGGGVAGIGHTVSSVHFLSLYISI